MNESDRWLVEKAIWAFRLLFTSSELVLAFFK